MKLRINGNSLRLRITPSELSRLLDGGRIEETIRFGTDEDARLTYALEHQPQAGEMSIRYTPLEVAIVVSSDIARRWAETQTIGLYGQIRINQGILELAVEKDFACLDKSHAENADTFPNPAQGTIC